MNRVLIPSTGRDLYSEVDPRFGRAHYLIVYDLSQDAFTVAENTVDRNADQGAGIQTAMKAVDLGVDSVITVHCGPKAFRVLREAGIRVFLTPSGTVMEAIQKLREGALADATEANVEGHW